MASTATDPQAREDGPEERPEAALPGLGERLAPVRERFEARGVVGVLVVDVAFLGDVERRHGLEARAHAARALSAMVQEVAAERLEGGDVALMGESGRDEVVVLVFRPLQDARFYRQELPGFGQALRQAVERRARVFYPYLRRPPAIECGTAVALRNPRFSADTQVRKAVEEARDDAALNARITARERRRGFVEMVLDRRITSVYEPIVDVKSRTVFGYEALARGPAGTPLHAPVVLFGAAIREDWVFELDCLCRESALKGAIDFPEATKLFVNILPTTFHDPNFRADRLVRTLEECELRPSDLVFEISEQESIESFAAFKEMRDAYRSFGFQFALDDTGSGYAGLEALLELSPEFIKVDRNFVSGVDQDAARQDLLGALLRIAQKAGSRVIGEGLDTLEELEMLGELGIHYGQGWLFGRPTPLRADPDD